MFFRLVFGMIAAILTITVMRTVVGEFLRMIMNSVLRPSATPPPPPRDSGNTRPFPPRTPQTGGELKKCAVCGVYAPPAVRDGSASFCSTDCASKFVGYRPVA